MKCAACKYDLRRLKSHACPECGRSFDPNDPHSYVSGQSFRVQLWVGVAFAGGATIGLLVPLLYLWYVGGVLGASHRWAEIAFYPGFTAGRIAFDLGTSDLWYHLVGFVANSAAYGLVAVVLMIVFHGSWLRLTRSAR